MKTKEEKRIYYQEYYQKNKERGAERAREWYQKNKEWYYKYVKEIYIEKKEIYKKRKEIYSFGRPKKVILSRDNFQCQKCGINREEHYKKYKRDLEIHHIDGNGSNKLRKDRNNDLNNLITLCRKCHCEIKENGWSRKFKKCIVCGTTERKHHCKGMCHKCYDKKRRKY